MNNIYFQDNSKKYLNQLTKEEVALLPLYRDLISNIGILQEKLEKNFYRVESLEKLHSYVNDKKLRIGKYTVVEEKNSDFVLVKYNDIFQNEFENIKKILEKLNLKLNSSPFKDYIGSLIIAYSNNNFLEAYKKWVQLPSDINLDLVAFPTEPYFDTKFETMLSFEGHLKLTTTEAYSLKSSEYEPFIKDLLSSIPKVSEVHYSLNFDTIRARVEDSLIMGGATPGLGFIAQNLPNEREFINSWGVKICIYKSQLDAQINKEHFPVYKKYFLNPDLDLESYTYGFVRVLLGHEVTESLMKYRDDEDRLKSKYLSVRELNSDITGLENYILYMLKSINAEERVKATIHSYVSSLLSSYIGSLSKSVNTQHINGYIYAFNYLLDAKALTLEPEGKIKIDVRACSKALSDLSKITSNLLLKGTKADADLFFGEHLDTTKLSNIVTNLL
ncbi:hypothetical protein COV24_04170 [candidate division WWE3 bacterium CG10_big_fil_rev_8_21_14_0_10_32_10]|uniref:Uncharacterized protein n=1 Tax=candidate division WWE3 bacterium CG10_big_fil_rev_8_21_14_0_10_32_10 TaxID=1975090 RepID=A0A2H0R9F0_UNCKA|nr:MAG: hypothetical protein COV24_04170 [candidate division WWE3 bacterium CG10_big_fil_rev_8_21_14_0_10_32_10]